MRVNQNDWGNIRMANGVHEGNSLEAFQAAIIACLIVKP
jgi:hypothetical protein